ncbi:ATPase [Sphingomonas changnyeongensis]|uniref:ATPase n=1 Tax=Sphingomonas changnyeongensis TaxID=2698679 RepID=A0A7Z2NVM9_9SPHN|nr:ATP12 family protein [Sphingomonas changnyeongensis]QHL90094.1 ATPase [Sphingomonas changnyeongensis]
MRLDGRPVRTPGRAPLAVPQPALAAALADEWQAVGEMVDPRAMPLTGLANAAIDIVTPDPARFAAGLARYAETDLLAYRAGHPEPLVARQQAAWDPLIGWAERRYDVTVTLVEGVMHRPQPEASVTRLGAAVAALDPFMLAGLSPVVTIGGSLIAALALIEGAAGADALWDAVMLDELWQEEQWGADDLALAARAARRADWDAAVRFLTLLRG